MKKQMVKIPDQNCSQTESTRRTFLGGFFSKSVGVAGLSVLSAHLIPTLRWPKRSPKELSLQEADFYAPHSLAG